MKRTMTQTMMSALIGTCLMAMPVLAMAGDPIDETRAMNADGSVTVINVKGEIEVVGWDSDQVRVTGRLGRGSKALEITGDADDLRIEVKLPNNTHGIEESELLVMMPRTADLEVEAVSADIRVSEMDSRSITLQSVSGDVDIQGAAQELDVGSVSGDVEARGSFVVAEIASVSGDARIDGVTRELSASSVSGDVEAIGGELSRARFESVSGEVEVTASLTKDGLLTVESLSGDVTLNLPASLSARVEAESFSGSIDSDMGEPHNARHGPETSMEYVAGDGDARIQVETFSGDVKIRHQ